MKLVDDRSGIEVIAWGECMDLLAQEEVGRLAVVIGGHPHVFPVNYVLDGTDVVFRTADGTKLDGSMRESVAFEVDRLDSATRSGWSVVVHGVAQPVTTFSPAYMRRPDALQPWAAGDKPRLVRITPMRITGRRVG